MRAEIKRVKHSSQSSITEHLTHNLEAHLELCMDMSRALCDVVLQLDENEQTTARNAFRHANLIRHHFVRLPLLNYTTYSGSLITRKVEKKININSRFLALSPRFVNFDECLMLANSGYVRLNGKDTFDWACNIYKTINGIEVEGIEWDYASVNRGTPGA